MRVASFIGVVASASLALCSGEQRPLGASRQAPLSGDDAPSYRSELLSLHKSLIEISSISGTEHDVGVWLESYLAGKGYTTARQKIGPFDKTPPGKDRFNVLAWRPSDGDFDPKVAISSHIDVVPPHIPYGIDDGEVTKETRISGRGSVDAKGSVAAQITAVEELFKAGKVDASKLLLLFVVGEEKTGDGMRGFSDSLASKELPYDLDAVIFGEPTENKLACGHKGALFCDVTTKGFPGHSGYPWLGKSANELMIRAFAKILDTDLGTSPLFGNTTVNIGSFHGGVASNVIPEKAVVGLGVRVASGSQEDGHQIVHDKIQAIFDEIDKDAFTFDCSHGYGPVEANCDVDDFDTIVVNYGTDIPNLKGDQTRYLYGPGNILVAHGAQENVTVADLETAVEDFQKLVLHALKQ